MENNFDCLLLASGGMDSTVLAYKLAKENKNVVILFIDYGQHCKDKEYQTLIQMLNIQFHIIHLLYLLIILVQFIKKNLTLKYFLKNM